MSTERRCWWGLGAISSVLVVVVSIAIGGIVGARQADAADPEIESGVQATVQAIIGAYNRGDAGALLPLFTDEGFVGLFGESKTEAIQDDEFFGDQVKLHSIHDVVATSSGATATVEIEIGLGIEADDMTFTLTNQRWVISDSHPGQAAVPAGVKVVDLKLQEYAFIYDASAVAGGNVALNVSNVGTMEHEVILVKTDPSTTADDILNADMSGPPPFEDFGYLGTFEPGESRTVVLNHPLESGTYFFICFLPAPDGTPHAAHGMISKFTVGSGASTSSDQNEGGAITPPSTGDAGLLSDNN
jgi:hypothetical protein